MDSIDIKDILRALAIIVGYGLYVYFSNRAKNKKEEESMEKRMNKAPHVQRTRPPKRPRRQPPVVAETPPPPQNDTFEEGVRVTVDEVTDSALKQTEINPELQKDELRRAVIWSEILTPKFKQY